ncbi:hypothetical protein AAMO2058_000540400 [Amorphochlora amoebiformis]
MACQQFGALMKKNFLLKRRMLGATICEILLPTLCLVVMVAIRQAVIVHTNDPNLHLGDYEFLPPSTGPLAYGSFMYRTKPKSPEHVVFARSMRDMAYKLLVRGHIVGITPNTYPYCDHAPESFSSQLSAIITEVATNLSLPMKQPVGGAGDVDNYVKGGDYPKNGFLEAGVDFNSIDAKGLNYVIRMNQSQAAIDGFHQQVPPSYTPKVDKLQIGQDLTDFNTMMFSGLMAFQNLIETWGVSYVNGYPSDMTLKVNAANIRVSFGNFTQDGKHGVSFGHFTQVVTRLVKQLVEEKEHRLKEGLKIMGMNSTVHFLSWFATYFIVFLFMSLLITLITWGGQVYVYSNLFIIFLYFVMFSIFATVGSTVSAILFLALFLGSFGINGETTKSQKVLACLSAPICFGMGAVQITTFESAQQGVNFDNLGAEENEFSMATCIGMLIFDFVLYLAIAIYAEKVLPTEWGVALKPWFCFLPSYWCPTKPEENSEPRTFDDRYEDTDSKAPVGIAIRNLEKRFGNQTAEEAAVKSINLDMYESQILALLGHNGAGKTTTINMLTGMLSPTSGDALIYGYNINTDMGQIRNNLGVCPQHNVLYDKLTVKEHLELYANIKRVPKSEIPERVRDLIAKVGLTEKVGTFSMNLSGEKLSVAIALIGGSKTVILDEPTSGMDPYSRRSTWEMLKQAKIGRVLVLTTHFMDEADQLGDRIAIMHRGLIKCCGSSLFLKSKYGVGYTLTIDKADHADIKSIKNTIHQSVPKAKLLSEVAGEISFQLPFSDSSKFPDMFDTLDKNKKEWGIHSYGVSVTTLEEVFLKVGHESEETMPEEIKRRVSDIMSRGERAVSRSNIDIESKAGENDENNLEMPLLENDPAKPNGKSMPAWKTKRVEERWGRLWIHFIALLWKRWHNAKRDKKVWMWQILYPSLWLLGGIGLLKFAATLQGKNVNISLGDFNSPLYVPINYEASQLLMSTEIDNNAIYHNATRPAGNQVQDEGCIGTDIPVNSTTDMARYLLYLPTYGLPGELGVMTSIFFNSTGLYAANAFMSTLNEAVGRVKNPGFSIDLNVKAWPLTQQEQTLGQGLTSIVVAIAFAFVPASIVGFVVMERQTKSKHLQIISGISTTAYWLSNLLWDFLNFIPPCLIALAVFAIYDISSLTGEGAGALFLCSLLYALAVITFTYCMSFAFTNAPSAQSIMLMLYIFTGCILLIASIIMDIIPTTKSANDKLKYVYRFVPSYSFGECVINLMTRDSVLIWGEHKKAMDWEIIGRPCVYLVCEFIAYLSALLLIEQILATPKLYGMFFRPIQVEDEAFEDDVDVLKEKERIQSGKKLSVDSNEDMVVLKGLRKVYPGQTGPKVAVKDVWFGIPEGQCFGFLGINGAGTATLAGLDVLSDQLEVRKLIGYCPQFDALLPLMTARETLRMFARIKGVNAASIEEYVEDLCRQLSLDINGWLDKPCGGYSGGNKRKLSVGIALVGNPPVVFLDEPSTGMDPGSRRFMWDLISSTMAERSVILTTHSMEECEALCSRLGIMVGGRFRCIGSSQRLKTRYGSGYQIDVKVSKGGAPAFKTWLKGEFKETKILEDQGENMKFRINPPQGTTLGGIFRLIEKNRKTQAFGIIEYSVSETSLEQIFIHFARQQQEETGTVAGLTNVQEDTKTS